MTLFALIYGSLTMVALANPIRKQVTFMEPVKVNGVLVKAGTYDVAFDEGTSELTISKGKLTIAKATARLEKLEKSSRTVYALWSDVNSYNEPKVLTSVTVRNGTQAKLVNAGDTKAAGAQ